MGDRVLVQFPVPDIYLDMWPATQVNLAWPWSIPSWVGTMSTNQWAVMPCSWEVTASMVRVWAAGKTVWSHCYIRAISERRGVYTRGGGMMRDAPWRKLGGNVVMIMMLLLMSIIIYYYMDTFITLHQCTFNLLFALFSTLCLKKTYRMFLASL